MRPKLPGEELTTLPWHQDSAYMPDTAQYHWPAVWLPLLDGDRGQRSDAVSPRHPPPANPAPRAAAGGRVHDAHPSVDPARGREVVTLEMPRGDFVIFHNHVFHRSTANREPMVRWSVDLRFSPAGTPMGDMWHRDMRFVVRTAGNRHAGPDLGAGADDVADGRPAHHPALTRHRSGAGPTLILVYLVAVPIGIYSATHPHSFGDYVATVFGFLGLATPNFLLALILMYLAFTYFGWSPGGLFSREYLAAGWSFGKVVDLLKHLPIPFIVIGTAGTAEIIRILRASLLDELSKQYVITPRSKGMQERAILFKYPVRVALNPIISTVGYLLPAIVSGETLTAIVLSLPTHRPAAAGGAQGAGHVLGRRHSDAARRP